MTQQSIGDSKAAAANHYYDRFRAAREGQNSVDHNRLDKVVRLLDDFLFVVEAGRKER